MEVAFAAINGTRFYYEIAGEGRPLVLVHAGIADSRMWNEQFHAFAEQYQVIRYDRRGFGKTTMVAGPYAHQQDLYDLLQFLGIEEACFVGCSQGGKTVIDFTLEHPAMVQALVLVASALSGFSFAGTPPWQAEELELADYLAQAITGAQKVVLAGTARLPNMEQPELFNAHLRQFGLHHYPSTSA